MTHHIYHTDAFVLGGYNTGEAHRYISVLAEEIGFVRAVVRSARNERSKLRYSLQEYSKVRVSLVRGRDVWRVTGATEYFNLYYHFNKDQEKQALLSRLHSLLRRLLHGEEANEYLFKTLDEVYTTLGTAELSAQKLSSLECISVLRILHSLGYLKHDEEFSSFFVDTTFTDEALSHVYTVRGQAIAEINQSLLASHL